MSLMLDSLYEYAQVSGGSGSHITMQFQTHDPFNFEADDDYTVEVTGGDAEAIGGDVQEKLVEVDKLLEQLVVDIEESPSEYDAIVIPLTDGRDLRAGLKRALKTIFI